jgi:hypothetical protein
VRRWWAEHQERRRKRLAARAHDSMWRLDNGAYFGEEDQALKVERVYRDLRAAHRAGAELPFVYSRCEDRLYDHLSDRQLREVQRMYAEDDPGAGAGGR